MRTLANTTLAHALTGPGFTAPWRVDLVPYQVVEQVMAMAGDALRAKQQVAEVRCQQRDLLFISCLAGQGVRSQSP